MGFFFQHLNCHVQKMSPLALTHVVRDWHVRNTSVRRDATRDPAEWYVVHFVLTIVSEPRVRVSRLVFFVRFWMSYCVIDALVLFCLAVSGNDREAVSLR